LILTVGTKPTTVTTTESICFGNSFIWPADEQIYTASGTYTQYNDGCTADQILDLTVGTKPTTVTTTESICFGGSFVWPADGKTYTASGTYTQYNDGCTADQILDLTVGTKPTTVTTTESICFGNSFIWPADGKTYTASGTYTQYNDGCTSDQQLILTVGTKPTTVTTTESICYGSSFRWPADGKTYATSGTYTQYNDGCTSDQLLILTVGTKPTTVTTTESICFGNSFIWPADGKIYTTSGTYTQYNDGCTADQILNLTVGTKPTTVTTTEAICFGESFLWEADEQTYNASGTYTQYNDGCTADQILKLTVGTKPETITTTEAICFGESFLWEADEQTYTASGTYTQKNNGCTADQILKLTVGTKPETITTTEAICFGGSFLWEADEQTYTASGTYTQKNNGCTADQILKLTVGNKPETITTTEAICFGESFLWEADEQTYTASGTYTQYNDGCTADQILKLTVGTKPETITTTESICFGESFLWEADEQTYTASGTYTQYNDGCTADQQLILTVGTKPTTVITTESICYGSSFRWPADGKTYATSGTYTQYNDGCTADQQLILTVVQPLNASLISLQPEICAGDNNGSFEIEISGSTGPYNISLDNPHGQYEQLTGNRISFINLSEKLYTVYIKDALNCAIEIEVLLPKAIAINPVAHINYSCENDVPSNSVTIVVDPSVIDLTDLDYSLDGTIYQPDKTFINVASGSHTIKARHTNGCIQSTAEFFIDYIEPLTITLSDGELNQIIATAKGGNGNYRYSFAGESFNSNNKFIIYKSGTYEITAEDQNGCTVTISKYFEFIDVCIPNHFTPNGDGINDEWGPGCTINYKNLTFTIFDRYGRVIGNYKYGQKWDGKYNGQELSSGDYWYVFKLNDDKDNREFVGHFTLYR